MGGRLLALCKHYETEKFKMEWKMEIIRFE